MDATQGPGDRALVVLATVAAILLLYWGAPFFIPLFVALLIAYALSPLVDQLMRLVRYRDKGIDRLHASPVRNPVGGARTIADPRSADIDKADDLSLARNGSVARRPPRASLFDGRDFVAPLVPAFRTTFR